MKELLHDDDVRRDAFAEGRTEGIALGKTEGIALGTAKGRSEERVNTIQKMLTKGFALDVIQSLDFSEDEIRKAQTAILTKA